MWAGDPPGEQVQALGRPVMGRERHTACMVQHYMVVCGGVVRAGQDADYTLLGDVQVWLPPLPPADLPGC